MTMTTRRLFKGLRMTVAPSAMPVTVAECRDQARIEGTHSDVELSRFIDGASKQAATRTGKGMVAATYEMELSGFPPSIELPWPPLQSVTSITYVDSGGDMQTLEPSFYSVQAHHMPGMVKPVDEWPCASGVTINFISGYPLDGGVATTPADIRAWIMVQVATMDAMRIAHGVGSGQWDATGRVDTLLEPILHEAWWVELGVS